jgi:hypothetical protein
MQRIVQVYITYEDPRKTVGCLRVLLLLLLIRCCFAVVSSIRSSLCPLLNTVLYVSYYYEYDPRFQYVGGRVAVVIHVVVGRGRGLAAARKSYHRRHTSPTSPRLRHRAVEESSWQQASL